MGSAPKIDEEKKMIYKKREGTKITFNLSESLDKLKYKNIVCA